MNTLLERETSPPDVSRQVQAKRVAKARGLWPHTHLLDTPARGCPGALRKGCVIDFGVPVRIRPGPAFRVTWVCATGARHPPSHSTGPASATRTTAPPRPDGTSGLIAPKSIDDPHQGRRAQLHHLPVRRKPSTGSQQLPEPTPTPRPQPHSKQRHPDPSPHQAREPDHHPPAAPSQRPSRAMPGAPTDCQYDPRHRNR
jgi:hypothetical protein